MDIEDSLFRPTQEITEDIAVLFWLIAIASHTGLNQYGINNYECNDYDYATMDDIN